MVVNRGTMKRKRKSSDVNILLDESPKRTKVQAQRKFAQGSNVNSPVLTPIEEIEATSDRRDVLPEPQEFETNAKRPHTEDFLTFLCFRGTPILPPNLNFFNTASINTQQEQMNAQNRPSPIATGISLTSNSASPNSKPFIAFGVRKRADPIVISKQMDRKRRHALALQALRRKYQEQKMAKIRAITISKLSEKVNVSKNIINKDVVRTRSVTKTTEITKKKSKVKVVSTKCVSSKNTVKKVIRGKIKPKMCLRSFRGRFAHQELTKVVKRSKKGIGNNEKAKKVGNELDNDDEEAVSEFSSDDDEPLVKTVKVKRVNCTRSVKKIAGGGKKGNEVSYRLTRSTRLNSNTKLNRKVIYTKSTALRPRRALHSKIHVANLQERIRTRNQKIADVKKAKRNVPKPKINAEKTPTPEPEPNNDNIKETRSKTRMGSIETKEELKKKVQMKPKITRTSERNNKETKITEKSPEKITKTNLKDTKSPDKVTKTNEKVTKTNEKVTKTNEKVTKAIEKDTKTNEKVTTTNEKDTRTNIKDTRTNEKDTKTPEKVIKTNEKVTKAIKTNEKDTNTIEKVSKTNEKVTKSNEKEENDNESINKKEIVDKTVKGKQIDNKNARNNEKSVLNKNKQIIQTVQTRQGTKIVKKKFVKPVVNKKILLKNKKKVIKAKETAKKEVETKEENTETKDEQKEIKKETPTTNKNIKNESKIDIDTEEALAIAQSKLKEFIEGEYLENKLKMENEKLENKAKTLNKTEKIEKEIKNVSCENKINTKSTKEELTNEAETSKLSNVNEKTTKNVKEAVKVETNANIEIETCKLKTKSNKVNSLDVIKVEDDKLKHKKVPMTRNRSENKITSSQINQRPSRKTKEAATIYMEILSRKLVHEEEIDDDNESIDSFPELPNVRKTEQRENELKAKAQIKIIPSSNENDQKEKSLREDEKVPKNLGEKLNSPKLTQNKDEPKNKEETATKTTTDEDIQMQELVSGTLQLMAQRLAIQTKFECGNKGKTNKNATKGKIESKQSKNKSEIVKTKAADVKINDVLEEKDAILNKSDSKSKNLLKKDTILDTNINKATTLENKTIVSDDKMMNFDNKKAGLEDKTVNLTEKIYDKTINLDSKKRTLAAKTMNLDKNVILDKNIILDNKKVILDNKSTILDDKLTLCNDKTTVSNKKDENLLKKNIIMEEKDVILNKNKKDSILENKSDTKLLNNQDCIGFNLEKCTKIEKTANVMEHNIEDTKFKTDQNKKICDVVSISENVQDSTKQINLNEESSIKQVLNKSYDDLNTKKLKYSSDSENSTTSDKIKQKQKRLKKKKKHSSNSFSDSDEEPLSKFTTKPKTENDSKQLNTRTAKRKSQETELPTYSTKREKRECAKRPQNYLTMFSSSDEDEKMFLGFKKVEQPKKVVESTPKKPIYDLLNKEDVNRRYVNDKINNANERIEQWLEDSEKANKKEIDGKKIDKSLVFNEKTVNYNEKIDIFNIKNVFGDKNASLDKVKSPVETKSDEKQLQCDLGKQKAATVKTQLDLIKPSTSCNLERKTIFKKEKKTEITPKINAFNANNESSVYAFEDMELSTISTPFRRPCRRPSSSTFNSEDEIVKDDKFRQPVVPKTTPQKEFLISDDSNNDVDSCKNEKVPKKLGYMCPPLLKNKIEAQQGKNYNKIANKASTSKANDSYDDFKYKIPSSPSASSSSSAKLANKRTNVKMRQKLYEFVSPVQSSDFPGLDKSPQMVEAPVFHPTEKEFQDPIEYIEKIKAQAQKFGICRIIPPSSFKPECKVADDMRFTSYNQYVNKMLYRWGPNFKELMAIKKYLKTQNITLNQAPWIGGMEVDLPRLYQTVQSLGGLKEVIEKKKWAKVSDSMKIPKSAQDRVTKLDDIYCKYLLPYDTLSPAEREKLFDEVETEWAKKESRLLQKTQENIETTAENSENDSDDESEECIVKGRNMALNGFYRIARNTMSMWFKTSEPDAEEVEQEFWKHVTNREKHICVHSGSIDSGNYGYGFAVTKNSPFARHSWNLKVLTNNSGSILRSMGPIMGVTVPTLHVGMVFSTCCWYRDPHSLPWVEYLHTGNRKIWYAIPDSMSGPFKKTVGKLVPNYCRNKSIWLSSDTVMIPPNLLLENQVSLSRTVQEPGQYIVIFPKVFTSSLCTGYVVSESVYVAPSGWLKDAQSVFDELKKNCEPPMFSFERLLMSIALDSRSNVDVLRQIQPNIVSLCDSHKKARGILRELGVVGSEKLPPPDAPGARKRKKLQGEGDLECEVCRENLFVTMVNETTEDLVYCIEHAVEILKDKKVDPNNCKMLYTYDDSELEQFTVKLETLIQSKMQKKTVSKFAGMPTLLK